MIDNVNEHGVGAMNIDACRVPTGGEQRERSDSKKQDSNITMNSSSAVINVSDKWSQGRHPANLIHDGSESVESEFLEQGGIRKTGDLTGNKVGLGDGEKYGKSKLRECHHVGDTGTASRFFNSLPITELDAPFKYTAKASKRERNEGLEPAPHVYPDGSTEFQNNHHPTVKPIALMDWLVKLITPHGGTCLDPFMGSGTTGIACVKNNFNFIGIEREEEFYEIAKQRIENAQRIHQNT